VTNCLYLDDYDSHMTVTGNVCAGISFIGVLIHGGTSDTLSNNLFDMGVTFAAKGTNNANPLYYQDNNIYHGSKEFFPARAIRGRLSGQRLRRHDGQ
jgi:hypothetical protein